MYPDRLEIESFFGKILNLIYHKLFRLINSYTFIPFFNKIFKIFIPSAFDLIFLTEKKQNLKDSREKRRISL